MKPQSTEKTGKKKLPGKLANWKRFSIIPLSLVTFFALYTLGWFDTVIALLDSDRLAYNTGDVRVSAFDILKAFFAILTLYWVTGIVSTFGDRRIQSLRMVDAGTRNLLTKVFHIVLYALMGLIGLDLLNIDLRALTFLGGAVGIGIGFGLQKITSNFISGVILLFEKSINNGDLVQLSDGKMGFIRKLGTRHTLMETFDGREIMIPNENFIIYEVVNLTYSNKKGRISIPIGVSYDSDIALARELMLEAAGEHPRSSKKIPPECYLREFADSSVNFELFFWVDNVALGRYEPQSDVMFAIWEKFAAHDISIPFPQQDLHIITSKGKSKITKPSQFLQVTRAKQKSDTKMATPTKPISDKTAKKTSAKKTSTKEPSKKTVRRRKSQLKE